MSESVVLFVACPECGDKVPIPTNAVGPNRSDLWNVVGCFNCNVSFDYNCEEVKLMPIEEWHELIGLQPGN